MAIQGVVRSNGPDLQLILAEIDRYWEGRKEIVFPADPDLLHRLLANGQNSISIRVKSMQNPNKVVLSWGATSIFDWLSSTVFLVPREMVMNLTQDFIPDDQTYPDMFIGARLCKSVNGEYGLFLHRFIGGYQNGGGTGGDTLSAGAKIPSHA